MRYRLETLLILLGLTLTGLPGLVFGAKGEPTAAETPKIALLPKEITLTGPEARQHLLAVEVSNGEFAGQIEDLSYTVSDPSVVALEDGVLAAKGNGSTTVTVKAPSGAEATARVTVKDFDQPWEWSFRNHVQSVLSKAGCNSGACHGALAGKGGFRLSLRAYAPEDDYHTIVRETRGRRVELADPGRSLVLTKPTTAVRHKGGKLLEPGSRDYQVLAEWISNGAAPPSAQDASLTRLEVLPALSSLKPGDTQKLLVRAYYSDGREEDVTQWAKFTSSNEVVAQVDDDGNVTVVGSGEGAITAWFSSQIVIARVTSPYDFNIPDTLYSEAPRKNFIDDLVLAQLKRLHLKPSPRASDEKFLRRAYLDTIGTLPTPEEVTSFLEDDSPEKRDRLVEELLNRPEFVDYWTYRWSDILLVNGNLLRPDALKAYYEWIRGNVASNTPWNELVSGLITAKGGSLENGATNFFAVHQDPETMAENVSQAFLSLSINCAKCHNHPLEKWTNDQYYSFANLFSRVRAKGWGGGGRNGDGVRTLYVEPRGDLMQPRTGKPQPPAPLDGEPLPYDDTEDRREYLADWLTSPDNLYFSRSITNRVWAAFFGVGIVEPVDDLRASNPASNEALLDAASGYLVESGYDLKALMRVILRSETYQRSSNPLPENETEQRYYSRYYPRRHMAEVLYDAISQVTRMPGEFTEVAFPGGDMQKTEFYPKGTRALGLYDSAVNSYFLSTFGRNPREITCECERSNQPSMVQVLHISNGDTLNNKLSTPEGRVAHLVKGDLTDHQIINEAYLLSLSRYPTQKEVNAFLPLLADVPPDGRQAAVEDLFWALMSSREFLFQH